MNPVRMVVAERNYLRGVLRAFLEGKKNQNYVLGCFRNVPISIFDEIAKDLSKYAEVRSISENEKIQKMLGRFYVIDNEQFIIGLTDDNKTHPTQDVALWTQSSHATSNVFEPMFNLVWSHSKPVR